MFASSIFKISHLKGCDDLRSKYQIKENFLGKGAYGKVYEGEGKNTEGEPKKVAIKIMPGAFNYPVTAHRLYREISILRMLKGHPNIISLEYIAASATENAFNEFNLVFDCFDTNLYKIIKSKQKLSTKHIQFFLYQILCGIYFVHSAKVVHRDLKPENILVNRNDCYVKICDFGLARAIETKTSPPPVVFRQLSLNVVTSWYRCPELLLGCRGEEPVDMWSIGCILAELLMSKALFPAVTTPQGEDNTLELLQLIFNLIGTPEKYDCSWINKPPSYNYVINLPRQPRQNFQEVFKRDDEIPELLENLLEFNPHKRIKAENALNYSFFRESSRYNSRSVSGEMRQNLR